MKTFLSVISVLLLCSCAAAPTLQTSVNGNAYVGGPTNINDPRLRAPQFYMDDDKSPMERAASPQAFSFYGTDNFCTANCQARRNALEYCSRACAH
jgi:hypothetical protein